MERAYGIIASISDLLEDPLPDLSLKTGQAELFVRYEIVRLTMEPTPRVRERLAEWRGLLVRLKMEAADLTRWAQDPNCISGKAIKAGQPFRPREPLTF